MESFIGSFKRECLNHLILTSEEQLRYVIREYLEYYNHERPHAGLGGRMIKPRPQDADGEIVCTERLGGRSNTTTGCGGRHDGFLLYCHRSFPSQEIHQRDGGIHWQSRSKTFTGKAYPACFEHRCEARGILRASEITSYFLRGHKGLTMPFPYQEAIG